MLRTSVGSEQEIFLQVKIRWLGQEAHTRACVYEALSRITLEPVPTGESWGHVSLEARVQGFLQSWPRQPEMRSCTSALPPCTSCYFKSLHLTPTPTPTPKEEGLYFAY